MSGRSSSSSAAAAAVLRAAVPTGVGDPGAAASRGDPRLSEVATREGRVEVLVVGTGDPVTVVAHGLGSTLAEIRALASGIPGTRAFLAFRGHGRSPDPDTPYGYASLARQLRAVVDHVGATCALGVSMGAGAVLRMLSGDPAAFERIALLLPAALDRPRDPASAAHLASLADALDAAASERALQEAVRLVLDEQPAALRARPDVRAWAARRASVLAAPPLRNAMRQLAVEPPLEDRTTLAEVRASALVVGQGHDLLHPLPVARDVAMALPQASLRVFPNGGLAWTHRVELRQLLQLAWQPAPQSGWRSAPDA